MLVPCHLRRWIRWIAFRWTGGLRFRHSKSCPRTPVEILDSGQHQRGRYLAGVDEEQGAAFSYLLTVNQVLRRASTRSHSLYQALRRRRNSCGAIAGTQNFPHRLDDSHAPASRLHARRQQRLPGVRLSTVPHRIRKDGTVVRMVLSLRSRATSSVQPEFNTSGSLGARRGATDY